MRRISSRSSGSYSAERRCQSSPRSSLRRSISSWISGVFSCPVKRSRPPPHSFRIQEYPRLVEPLLVDPEVVGELVENGHPDLLLELGRVGKRLDERQPEDPDPVGQRARPVAAARAGALPRRGRRGRGRRAARPRPRSRRSGSPRGARAAARRLPARRSPRTSIDRDSARSGATGRRFATSMIVAMPNAKPPMWAKNAVPPPACGCEDRRARPTRPGGDPDAEEPDGRDLADEDDAEEDQRQHAGAGEEHEVGAEDARDRAARADVRDARVGRVPDRERDRPSAAPSPRSPRRGTRRGSAPGRARPRCCCRRSRGTACSRGCAPSSRA